MRFITRFSTIVYPITLQKKGIKLEWTTKCEENFNLLKKLLTRAPILNIPDLNEKTLLCTDACKGLGGVLTQNRHGIGYESIKLKEHDRNYATHDLEIVSIVDASNMWRHYFMGKKFELRIYYSGVKYIFEQPTLNSRKTILMEF
jgi:hypothetical protein